MHLFESKIYTTSNYVESRYMYNVVLKLCILYNNIDMFLYLKLVTSKCYYDANDKLDYISNNFV